MDNFNYLSSSSQFNDYLGGGSETINTKLDTTLGINTENISDIGKLTDLISNKHLEPEKSKTSSESEKKEEKKEKKQDITSELTTSSDKDHKRSTRADHFKRETATEGNTGNSTIWIIVIIVILIICIIAYIVYYMSKNKQVKEKLQNVFSSISNKFSNKDTRLSSV